MGAWNGWYHVTSNTYGTWLPGDARGWRTRKHKQHVDGDYRDPPPQGSGDGLHRHIRSHLGQPVVRLASDQREIVGAAVLEMLAHQQIEILAISMDSIHCHLLGRFPDGAPRPPVGRAKKHATFLIRQAGHASKLWERKSGVTPVRDRSHQLNVYHYILKHAEQGAWVWDYRQAMPPPSAHFAR